MFPMAMKVATSIERTSLKAVEFPLQKIYIWIKLIAIIIETGRVKILIMTSSVKKNNELFADATDILDADKSILGLNSIVHKGFMTIFHSE